MDASPDLGEDNAAGGRCAPSSSEQAELAGAAQRRSAPVRAQLAIERGQVRLHGVLGDIQRPGDVLVGAAERQFPQHIGFPVGERTAGP